MKHPTAWSREEIHKKKRIKSGTNIVCDHLTYDTSS